MWPCRNDAALQMKTIKHRVVQGFTLFELAVVVAIMSVLTVVFLSRMAFYRNEAERLAFQQTVTALRTETSLQNYLGAHGSRVDTVHKLAGQNPMNWLEQKPGNYLGEFYSPDTKKLAKGSWFFDRSDGFLVYLLNESNTFDSEGSELLKFKVSLSQGSKKAAADTGEKLELVPVPVHAAIAVK